MGYIYANGIHQNDLYTLLGEFRDHFNTLCDQLTTDTNGTFTGTDYDLTLNMDNKTVTSGAGLGQDIVYLFLKDLISKYNTLMTALDSTDLDSTDYASGMAMTVYIDGTQSRNITSQGMFQGDLVYTLDHAITKWNALLVKLDTETLCSGLESALGITDTVIETGA